MSTQRRTSAAERERLAELLTPRLTKYHPHPPHPKQQVGLLLDHIPELFFGGAAGGGKSAWLLMGALQYVDQPHYNAIIFRQTFKQLSGAEGLIELSKEWLGPTDAVWHGTDMKWEFPSGATLFFGHLADANAHFNYQGLAYDFTGFDELTQLLEVQYRYIAFSRVRRRAGAWIPKRVRSTGNPGGKGHEWVKTRFGIYVPEEELAALAPGDPRPPRMCHRPEWIAENERTFLPSRIPDNPSLDREDYEKSLAHLDPTTRQQLLEGDWDARPPGEMFQRAWFGIVPEAPAGCTWARMWDMAATEESQENPDPDYTVGLKLGRHPNGTWYVAHVWRRRARSHAVEEAGKSFADTDGIATAILVEQEPGASGKTVVEHWQRRVLPRHAVHGVSPSGDKATRAKPVAAKAEAGLVFLVRGPWNGAFLDELDAFTTTDQHSHDDQVDGLSGAFNWLADDRNVRTVSYRPTSAKPVHHVGELRLEGEQYIDKE